MAARNKAWTPQKVRERIRTSMLMRRLTDHVLGKVELTQSQVTAATFLVSQSIGKPPQEIQGSVNHTHSYDEMLLALLNGRSTDERDSRSADATTH